MESIITKLYRIKHSKSSYTSDSTGNYYFETADIALKVAMDFKNNPRSHNSKMTDENVSYWKKQTYTIVEEIYITKEIAIV